MYLTLFIEISSCHPSFPDACGLMIILDPAPGSGTDQGYPVKKSTSQKVYKSKGPKSKGLQVKRSTNILNHVHLKFIVS